MLSEGYTKDQIRTIFVEKYGPNVLIAPPFSGFNILAWTLPFVALAGAGYFIFVYIKRRKENMDDQRITAKPRPDREDEIEDEIMRASIEEEMKKYR